MKATVLYSAGMFIGGVVMLGVGIGHVFLPIFGYTPSVVDQLESELANHFYFLTTYSLCAFFMIQGGLSLWLARRPASTVARQVAAVLMFWWWWRLVLEMQYPVEIAIFGIGELTKIMIPVIILTAAGYTLALLAGSIAAKQGDERGLPCRD